MEQFYRPICRPGQNQRSVYNGYKRVHNIKFQSVVLPNGLIGNLAGPYGKFIILKNFQIIGNFICADHICALSIISIFYYRGSKT